MKHITLICVVFFALTLPLVAQTPNPAPSQEQGDYVIGTEDVLSISVWKEPELSVKELVVRPDGKISMPLVNDIQASGFTPSQLQERITDRLKQFVTSPNVNVTVIKITGYTVSVVGMVAKPGPYMLGSSITVLDILARAGGLREDAKSKKIRILRKENGQIVQFPFNYNNVIKGKDLHQNIPLKSGDTVMVP